MKHRSLTRKEIEYMEANNCCADNWETVKVGVDCTETKYRNVVFRGNAVIPPCLQEPCDLSPCIMDACIYDCEIGNNVSIQNAGLCKNYHIEDDTDIQNAGTIAADKGSYFGNGVKVAVVNENGSRSVPIFDVMNSNMAYILAFYRYDTAMMQAVRDIAERYVNIKKYTFGTISKGCTVHNTGIIKNVNFGEGAYVQGALELKNGTIASSIDSPVRIGSGVIMRNFIMQSGSMADTGTVIENCLIGQAVSVGKQYSAENCLVFANSELYHGEGCALFAGPYTVSHHKSSLMIAGYSLFFNAGSNTNQSNHMYKSGPVHQGILERGSKTGSGSYIMWPSVTAPFTTVTGRHRTHIHTEDFPFSIITREGDDSVLYPGYNLTTAGTRRDSLKWEKRDARHHSDCLDYIHFDTVSPYVVQKAEKGLNVLKKAAEQNAGKRNNIRIGGCIVRRLLIKAGIKNYLRLMDLFLFKIIDNIFSLAMEHKKTLRQTLEEMENQEGETELWYDLGGLYTAGKRYESLKTAVTEGHAGTVEEVMELFGQIFEKYEEDKIAWGLELARRLYGVHVSEMRKEEALNMLKKLKESVVSIDKSVLGDAKTEYGEVYKIGYGRDGTARDREADFQNVRGEYDQKDVIKEILLNIAATEKKYELLYYEINKRWEQGHGSVNG